MISEIVLVNVSGENKPALMGMLTSTLTAYQVRILDLGQAVIHDELSLGMLIEIPDRNATDALKEALLAHTRALGTVIRFTKVSSAEYETWVSQQGKPRYIVTMLAGGVAAEQLAAVTAIVERHSLGVDGSGVSPDACRCTTAEARCAHASRFRCAANSPIRGG